MHYLTVLSLLAAVAQAYYLPGVAPHDYKNGAPVDVLVNTLSAVDSLIPYDFYHSQFHFCLPKEGIASQKESLGAILFGDRLYNSAFEVLLHVA